MLTPLSCVCHYLNGDGLYPFLSLNKLIFSSEHQLQDRGSQTIRIRKYSDFLTQVSVFQNAPRGKSYIGFFFVWSFHITSLFYGMETNYTLYIANMLPRHPAPIMC